MKRTALAALLAVAVGFGLSGCGSDGDAPSVSEPFAPTATTLTATPQWQGTGLYRAGGLVEPAAGAVTLSFRDDRTFSGTGGCNATTGKYTVQGTSLVFGDIAQTEKACPGPEGQQDEALAQVLARVQGFAIRANTLELQDGADTVIATFVVPGATPS